MGALGFKVEDYSQVKDVVNEAVKSKKPVVINAVIEGGANVLASRSAVTPSSPRCGTFPNTST